MRETQFISQNQKKWSSAESKLNLAKNNSNPDELSDLFVEITDDLSYSRTFYPNRSVRVYLNNIAQKVFYSVYQNRKTRLFNFVDFWRETVPQVIYESRRSFILAFLVFMLAAFIGAFSSYMDADFSRVVLGDEYIDMTMENIANGNPMAVYQDPNQREMFFKIAQNNLIVATICFVVGLLFGVGSLFVLIQNGIILGAFQYLFIKEGIYMESFFTIWMHGTIEISCIIIAGAAGLTLGSGLIFPKTLSRVQSLQLSARRGLLIMLTIIPLIILAAFIEGFVTRNTGASYIVRGVVIFGSLAFIVSYYVIYPWMKAQKGFTSFLGEVKLPPKEDSELSYNDIKKSAEIFSDSFIFYQKMAKPAVIVSSILAIINTTFLLLNGDSYSFKTITSFEQIAISPMSLIQYTFDNIAQFFLVSDITIPWVLNFIASSTMAYLVLFWVQHDANKEKDRKYTVGFFIKTLTATFICMSAMHLTLLSDEKAWLFLMLIFVVPVLMLVLATVFNENTNILFALGRALSLIGGNWTVMMGAYFIMGAMCMIFLFMATAPIAGFYLGVVVNAFPIADAELVRQGFYILLYTFMFSFLFPLVFIVMGIGFFSFRETKEATDLFKQIPTIGVRKISYGMEKES